MRSFVNGNLLGLVISQVLQAVIHFMLFFWAETAGPLFLASKKNIVRVSPGFPVSSAEESHKKTKKNITNKFKNPTTVYTSFKLCVCICENI